MDQIARLLEACKAEYDAGGSPLSAVRDTASYCVGKLESESTHRIQATIGGDRGEGRRRRRRMTEIDDEPAEVIVPEKSYSVFVSSPRVSRPFLPSMFLHNPKEFSRRWNEVAATMNPSRSVIEDEAAKVNIVLYTAINAFAICYDLWKPNSRKTPGTFLEVLMGSVLGTLIPTRLRGKFIAIPDQTERVATDISYLPEGGRPGLAFPAKITTRERIVQPIAHQRILDSVFGEGSFRSVLFCVSELQRDKDNAVDEICVPGPLRLYQSHVARLTGIYYLDSPTRYLQDDVTSVVPVGTIGAFLTDILPTLL